MLKPNWSRHWRTSAINSSKTAAIGVARRPSGGFLPDKSARCVAMNVALKMILPRTYHETLPTLRPAQTLLDR